MGFKDLDLSSSQGMMRQRPPMSNSDQNDFQLETGLRIFAEFPRSNNSLRVGQICILATLKKGGRNSSWECPSAVTLQLFHQHTL